MTAGAEAPVSTAMNVSFDDGPSINLHFDLDRNNCAVMAPQGKKLVGSIVGLGEHPVPFG